MSKGIGTVSAKPAPGTYKLSLSRAVSEDKATRLLHERGAKYVFPWSVMNVDSSSIASVRRYRAFIDAEEDLSGNRTSEAGDYYDALLAYLESRVNKEGFVDHDAIVRAAQHREQMPIQTVSSSAYAPSGDWQYVGPVNLPTPTYNYWYGHLSPVSGRVTCVTYGFNDPSYVYLGTAGGGLYKSTDGGVTWACISDKEPWVFSSVSAIAVDHNNPKIVYVGTGDYKGFFGVHSQGLMKTTDGGDTWTNYGAAQFGDQSVSAIAINEANPTEIALTTGHGSGNKDGGAIWFSTNSGEDWSRATLYNSSTLVPEGSWNDIIWGSQVGFIAIGTYANGVYLYSGNDKGFFSYTPPVNERDDGVTLALSATNGNAYIPMGYYTLAAQHQKVFWSYNVTGSYPVTLTNFPNGDAADPIDNALYDWSQASYDYYLGTMFVTDPSSKTVTDDIFCGLITLAETELQFYNGGSYYAWEFSPWLDRGSSFTPTTVLHNDQQCMNPIHYSSTAPDVSTYALFGGDAGIFKMTRNADGSNPTFTSLNKGLNTLQFWAIAPHPTDANRLIGGLQDNGSPSEDGSPTAWSNMGPGDGGHCGWDVVHNRRYFTTISGLVDIANPGGTPIAITDKTTWGTKSNILPFLVSNQGTPIAADYRLRKYTGSGTVWSVSGPGTTQDLTGGGSAFVRTLAMTPANDNIVYTGSSDGRLWFTTDLGASAANWHRADNGAFGTAMITAISVSPVNAFDVLVGTNAGGVFHCANTEASPPVWTSVIGSGSTALPHLTVNSLERSPADPVNSWYEASDIGVFTTSNAGAAWDDATGSLGMPNVAVTDLKVGAGYLYAGTFGRGIYRLAFPSGANLVSVAVDSSTINAGGSTGGTVTMDTGPSYAIEVGTSTSNASVATTSGSATVAKSATTGRFTVNAGGVNADTLVTIYASYKGVTKSTTVTVKAPHMVSVKCSPNPVIGGLITVGEADLSGPVAASGATITLQSSSTYATPPSSSAVAGSANKTTFAVNTSPVSVTTEATIFASFNGTTQSTQLQLLPAPLYSVTVTSPVVGGNATKGYVTLSQPAPAAGLPVTVSSNSSAATPTPKTFTVPAGATTYNFSVSTVGVASTTPVVITAKSEAISKTTTLQVIPADVMDVVLTPTSTYGGLVVTGKVDLDGQAPAAGATVSLSSGNTAAATVPTSVNLGAFARYATFPITTKGVGATTVVAINATYRTLTKSANLTLNPAVFYAFAPNRAVIGGNPAAETITLLGHAPPAGAVVSLASNNTAAAVPPATATVPANASALTVSILTKGVAATADAVITAGYGGIQKTITLAVNPAHLFSVTLPSSTVGGTTVTATITFDGQAPPAGATVALHSDSVYMTVGSSILMPAYGRVKTFSVATHKPSSTVQATLSAKYNGITKSAVITITSS